MVNYRKSSRKTRGQKRSSSHRRRASTTRRNRRSHSHRRRVIQSGG